MPSLILRTRVAKLPKMPGAGPVLQRAIQSSGLSIKELAKKTGLSKRRISQLSQDIRHVTVRDIQLLSGALGISQFELLLAQQARNQFSMAITQMNRQLNRQLGGFLPSEHT